MLRPFIDIVFDGPPAHKSGRFVEVHDHEGKSISVGEWLEQGEFWALRLIRDDFKAEESIKLTPEQYPLNPLIKPLIEAINSLEYVDRNYPDATGWGVRKERIQKAKIALAKVYETDAEGLTEADRTRLANAFKSYSQGEVYISEDDHRG